MSLGSHQQRFAAAREDKDLQNALLQCELWAAEALALLSQQSREPFTAAEFIAAVRGHNVPATPAYHCVQLESVIRRSPQEWRGPPASEDDGED